MSKYLKSKRIDVLLVFKNEEDVTDRDSVNRLWNVKYNNADIASINFANSISSLIKISGEDKISLNNIIIQVLSVDNGVAKVILRGNKEPWSIKIKRVVDINDLQDTVPAYMHYDELIKNTIPVDETFLSKSIVQNIINIAKTINTDNTIYFNEKTGELVWLNHDDSYIDEHIVVRMFSNVQGVKTITVDEVFDYTCNDFVEVEYMEYM